MEERAKSALEELKRVGGFDRKLLVVATPTGTGWLDESAVDTIEYMHGGDTAIVSMQYSYLPSWVTIVVDPQRSINSARALFDEVYGYWRTLPKDRRPKLYLYGLSLGALGGETCADLFTLFADPIHGGVFSGPPFPSRVWNDITKKRTLIRRCGYRSFATARWFGSRLRRTISIKLKPTGARCDSSTFSMRATQWFSSRRISPTASPPGSTNHAALTYRMLFVGIH